jgi:hypothetical protein
VNGIERSWRRLPAKSEAAFVLEKYGSGHRGDPLTLWEEFS